MAERAERRSGRVQVRPARVQASAVKRHRAPVHLVAHRAGRLVDPVQDASVVTLDPSHAMLLGGLTSADVSTNALRVVSPRSDVSAGRLPQAVHDSAAAQVDGSTYLFGGGTGPSQLDDIVRVVRGGGSAIVGHLPAPSSDQQAATIDGTAYVVGGYT